MWMIILIIFISCVYIYRRRTVIDLPGPPGWPVIGNILDIEAERLHVRLDDWAKIYGDIYKINLLGDEVRD